MQTPKPLPGVFTVNGSGKKVQFAPGNLFWDGREFKFEEHQYDFPTERNANHIGHFFWSKDASVACALKCHDGNTTPSDKFFAADGGAIEGWTVLSNDEWGYMLKNHPGKKNVTINGKMCLVLAPDGVDASVIDCCYSAAKWTEAEQTYGLVALPYAGFRDDDLLLLDNSYGYYWSVTHYERLDGAYYVEFNQDVNMRGTVRCYGFSVRLIKSVNITPSASKDNNCGEKTVTTEQVNSFIRSKGGTVSVEELCIFLKGTDRVIVGTSAIHEEFSIIDYLEKECPEFHSKNVRSLIVGFVQLKEEFGWSFGDIKERFLKEVKQRTSVPECSGFSLTRCLEGSLNDKEKEILPIYKDSYVAYITFID